MSLVIVKLFNKVLQNGKFLKVWNLSCISSMFKSGNPNDCNNYWGICISSCLGKLFTSLLQNRLTNFLEKHNLLSVNQGGFREGCRTSDHIYILKTLINKYLNKCKNNLYVCFVDFKNAFDSVVRKALMYKLLCKGIGGQFYDLLKHMYSNTCTLYCCKSEGYISEPFQANLGVKQGDSSSPILFNIFKDDVCSYFNNSLADPVLLNKIHFNHLLYADDLVLISETPSGLQHCVDPYSLFVVNGVLL